MKRAFLLAFLLCAAYMTAWQQERFPILCGFGPIRIASTAEVPGIKIQDTGRIVITTKASSAGLAVENLSETALLQVLVLVEYLDGNGQHLFTMRFYGAVGETDSSSLLFAIKEGEVQEVKEPIQPGMSFWVGSESPIIATRCPAQARVVFAEVRAVDGSSLSFEFPGWQIEPSIFDVPRYFDMSGVVPPGDVLVEVQIDREGHLSELRVMDAKNFGLVPWLSERLSQWSFVPALYEGKPVEGRLTLLLRFHAELKDDTTWLERFKPLPVTMGLVDIFPHKPEKGQWLVYLQGVPASSILPER